MSRQGQLFSDPLPLKGVAALRAEKIALLVEQGQSEQLRRLVLELAVRGQLLVPNLSLKNPSLRGDDAAASVGRRARARDVALPPVPEAERPFTIPPNWVWGRVDDTGSYVNGLAFKPSDWGTQGYPIIRIQNLTDPTKPIHRSASKFDDAYIVQTGDLLVSWSATLDVFIWDREPGVLNQHIFRVLPNEQVVLPRFLFHALRHCIRDMEESDHAHGLVMKHINRGPFLAHPVPIPPLAEQKRIVSKVDDLMKLIDDLEAKQASKVAVQTRFRTSALQALTRAEGPEELAHAWKRVAGNYDVLFERSEAVGELRGTILSLAAEGRLVPAGNETPTLPFGESYPPDLPVPAHWAWSPLGRLCKFIDYRGRTPVKTTQGVRLITAKNVRMGYLREEPREFIAESAYEGWMTRGLPRQNDVLFTTEAPLGNVALLDTSERVALAQRIITLRPIDAVEPAFLKAVLMSPAMQAVIRRHGTGMTAMGIKAAKLKMIPFAAPGKDEQQRIVAKVDALMKLCDELEMKLKAKEATTARLVEAVVAASVA